MDHRTAAWGNEQTHFFYELKPEIILESVERFGLRCTGRCNALNSMENRVYEIEIDKENSPLGDLQYVIAKFYRPGRWGREQIQEEHDYLHRLSDSEIPVIAPILETDSRESILEVKDKNIFFSIFPKIGGRAPDELSSEECEIVGRLLGRMHNVGEVLDVKHRIKISPQNYGLNYLDFFAQSPFVDSQQKNRLLNVVKSIAEQSEPLFQNTKIQAIHGDAHLGNLLHGREGFFWVDFDDMVIGPPVQDLWLILPGRDDYAKEKLTHVLHGYEMMRPFDRSSLRLIEPLRSLRMIHFAAWIGIRWDDPAFKRSFPFYTDSSYWQNLIHDLEQQLRIIDGSNSEFSWL